MEKYFHKKAKGVIRTTKIVAWIFIVIGTLNFISLIIGQNHDQYGNLYMPVWKTIFMISNCIVAGIIFMISANKLSLKISELSDDPYSVWEFKYNIKIVSPFIIWAGVTMSILDIGDKNIIMYKAYLINVIMVGVGVGWHFLLKYLLKKDIENNKIS